MKREGLQRNKPCRCESGDKYKHCHLYLDQGWIYDNKHGYWVQPKEE